MTYNFENNVVLTSQHPEAFLTLQWSGAPGEAYVDVSAGDASGNLFINGWDIGKHDVSNFMLKIDNNDLNPATFHIYTTSTGDFECTMHFNEFSDINATSKIGSTVDVSIFNRPFIAGSEINAYETGNVLVENESSYLLLRTNPKYSGNVKLMVDSSNNIFLDTFKVSEILSNKKYRKQKVSGNSFLSGDITRVFKSLPQGEMYRVDRENTLDISRPKTSYSEQYNTTYNYGARILIDELYSEKYSILAPLWINSKLPDFFAVFRLSGTHNTESYEAGGDIDGLAKNFITNADIVKNWSFKEEHPLGVYLNNHLTELGKYESPVSLSLNEYDANTWNGMTVDKGIIAGRSEVPYFFQKDASSFTKINAFVSQGFERQNMLCPNLVNLEYAFNDNDVSLYSMNRYFGLYLTENILYEISYHKDDMDGSVNIISLDGKDVSIFIDSSVFDINGNISTDYSNRLFVINDGIKLERIKNSNQFNTDPSTSEDYANRLGHNILNTKVTKKNINSFITFKLNAPLDAGEHLRVVDKENLKIWEVFGTNLLPEGTALDYVSTVDPCAGYPRIYRTAFSANGGITSQINSIQKAFEVFNKFEDRFEIGFNKGDSLSLIINDSSTENFTFQRLTSQTTDSLGSHDSSFNYLECYKHISFYNTFTPDSSDFSRVYFDASFGPVDFEIFGDRMSLMINMFNPIDASFVCYSFDSSITELFTEHVMYESVDNLNRRIRPFDISTNISHESLYLEDPTSSKNDALIITNKDIKLAEDNIWWGYDVFALHISLMGIDCVKDFDFTVYDNSTSGFDFKSDYRNSRIDDASMYEISISLGETKTISERNSYKILSGAGTITIDNSILNYTSTTNTNFNTFYGSATIVPTSLTRISYNSLSGSFNFSSYNSVSEENIDDYYTDLYIDVSKNYKTKESLKYGLVVPTVTKWGGIGKDVRNNDIRLVLTNIFSQSPTDIWSNFIPIKDTSLFSNEVSYPIFKYLSPGETFGGDYVYYDVNDIAVDASGNRTRIRDLMFDNPTVDIFSKMIYNTKNTSGRKMKSSIVYYNSYRNTLKTIIKGLNLEIEVTSTGEKQLRIKDWDRYRISLISSPSRIFNNNKPIEVIINENTKTILIIWYQGNELLHYNRSTSNYIVSQNILVDTDNNGGRSFSSFTIDASQTYVKPPFIVNTAGFTQYAVNMYDNSTYYDASTSSRFAQFNYNNNGLNSLFNAYSTNTVDASIFSFAESFNTFDQSNIKYSFTKNSISYGADISNISYAYLNNTNYYKNRTSNIDVFRSILNKNNISYSIIQEDNVLTFSDFSSSPIKIKINDPIVYKAPYLDTSIYTYNGSYKPIFRNILNFNDNESDLINIVKKDFIFANTDITSYDKIYQYWFNKVVETVVNSDSSNNAKVATNFNPFSSQWDNDYYILSKGNTDTKVDGFKSGEEKPAFFGSKLVALPDTIVISEWNRLNTNVTYTGNYHILEYNLSQAITDKFLNNLDFLNNWSGLSKVNDEDISRYINKTILNYYDISKDKLDVEVWTKPTYKSFITYTWDETFKLRKNVESWLSFEKGEYIYRIRINNSNFETIYSKITLNRKNKK